MMESASGVMLSFVFLTFGCARLTAYETLHS